MTISSMPLWKWDHTVSLWSKQSSSIKRVWFILNEPHTVFMYVTGTSMNAWCCHMPVAIWPPAARYQVVLVHWCVANTPGHTTQMQACQMLYSESLPLLSVQVSRWMIVGKWMVLNVSSQSMNSMLRICGSTMLCGKCSWTDLYIYFQLMSILWYNPTRSVAAASVFSICLWFM